MYILFLCDQSICLSNFHLVNCEGPEILSCLQANMLAYNSFMDPGRRQESPGSETRTAYYSQQLQERQYHHFSCTGYPSPSFYRLYDQDQMTPVHTVSLQERTLNIILTPSILFLTFSPHHSNLRFLPASISPIVNLVSECAAYVQGSSYSRHSSDPS